MARFFRHIVMAMILISHFGGAANADSLPPGSVNGRSAGSKKDSPSRWNEMRKVSRIVTAAIAKHKKDGTDPSAFYATANVSLCYRDIAIAAYLQPRTLAEAEEIAHKPESGVLGKALLEWNIEQETEGGTECFSATCRKRTVMIPLTQQGMGIHDEPIDRGVDYGARIIGAFLAQRRNVNAA